MIDIVSTSAPAALQAYDRVLTAGADASGDGQGLRVLLSGHLDVTGSLAGHRPDATDGLLRGVAGSISTARGISVVREVHDEHGSAVLHDVETAGGTVRFADFTFDHGAIDTLDLHHDAQDDIHRGGR